MFRPQAVVALISLAFSFAPASAQNLVISNDDGWATAQIRAQYEALTDAGYDVSLHDTVSFFGSNRCIGRLVLPCAESIRQRLTDDDT